MVHCLSLMLQPYVILCLEDLTQCNLACGQSSGRRTLSWACCSLELAGGRRQAGAAL